jgi:hypothetical protein
MQGKVTRNMNWGGGGGWPRERQRRSEIKVKGIVNSIGSDQAE